MLGGEAGTVGRKEDSSSPANGPLSFILVSDANHETFDSGAYEARRLDAGRGRGVRPFQRDGTDFSLSSFEREQDRAETLANLHE